MPFDFQSTAPPLDSVATINVLLDILEDLDILHKPANLERRIAWLSPYCPDMQANPLTNDNRVCYALDSENYEKGLCEHSRSLGLLILEPDEASPNKVSDSKSSLEKRLIVVRRKQGSPSRSEILNRVNSTLFNLYRWHEHCTDIVLNNGTVQELIDISESLFGNWLNVNDATYTLVAHARNMEPPDSLSKSFVELGCWSTQRLEIARSVGMFEKWRDQTGIQIFDENDVVPYQYITYVLKKERAYRGHVVMICNNRPLTPGLIDLFEALAMSCEALLTGVRLSTVSRAPYESFIKHLIEDSAPSNDYVENQMEIIGIGDMAAFCIAIIDGSEGSYSEQSSLLLSYAKDSLTNALVVLHDDTLLVLFYAPTLQSDIILKMEKELDRFCEHFDCIAYESSPFTAIEYFGLAYQQACATKRFRFAIENESIAAGKKGARKHARVFFFPEAFCSLVFARKGDMGPLIDYSLKNSLLDIIELLQAENDTPDLKVLYYYLYYERRATPTAERLGMHRNNVVYRIRAIENRYHISLDDFSTRQYLIACYQMKINDSPQFKRKLL